MWPDFFHDTARAIWTLVWFGIVATVVITVVAALGPPSDAFLRFRCDATAYLTGNPALGPGCVTAPVSPATSPETTPTMPSPEHVPNLAAPPVRPPRAPVVRG